MNDLEKHGPTVSIIVTCYNHGTFLPDAIRSIQCQTYRNLDIVVVDDGSTDNTRDIARSFPEIHYVYQPNAGLAAARNKGVDESNGEYLVFLDADDWLYPEAVDINLRFLRKHKRSAFASGWHDKVDEWGYPLENDRQEVVHEKHYEHLLQGNYIGMHAAVMYHRYVFHEFRFDATLSACEDYDFYLNVARKYPIFCHEHKLAAYRIHGKNMSANAAFMLRNVLKICNRQKASLKRREEHAAFRKGLKTWKEYYSSRIFNFWWQNIDTTQTWPGLNDLAVLGRNKPRKLITYLIKKSGRSARTQIKKILPDGTLKLLHKHGIYRAYTPKPGKINSGDFDRVTPFSNDFGFDRGGPIDRFYIENFLHNNRSYIRGNVLEIGDNEYTLKFGHHTVDRSDILHIDNTNAKATYIGDITNVPQLPSGHFDCIIFTQTLHLIYDFKSALKTCYRILKPGGCLLMTVPGITPVDRGIWKDYWLWSFTDTAIKRVMLETFNGSQIDVCSYGNVHVATAFLYGMGLPELRKESLHYHDPGYPVIVSAKAIKA